MCLRSCFKARGNNEPQSNEAFLRHEDAKQDGVARIPLRYQTDDEGMLMCQDAGTMLYKEVKKGWSDKRGVFPEV